MEAVFPELGQLVDAIPQRSQLLHLGGQPRRLLSALARRRLHGRHHSLSRFQLLLKCLKFGKQKLLSVTVLAPDRNTPRHFPVNTSSLFVPCAARRVW